MSAKPAQAFSQYPRVVNTCIGKGGRECWTDDAMLEQFARGEHDARTDDDRDRRDEFGALLRP